MRIKVFIENESGSNEKHLHDEKSLTYQETMLVSRKYPYPYGFVLNSTSNDGDNVDVFVITDQELKSGQILVCEAIGLMEQFEKSWDSNSDVEEVDHNILAKLIDEVVEIDAALKSKLSDFVLHAFDDVQENKVRVGEFLGVEKAIDFIADHQDSLGLILLNRFRTVPSINLMVGLYFFFIWCDLFDYLIIYLGGASVAVGLILPFVLLVGVLRYMNKLAFGTVVMIFLFYLMIKAERITFLMNDFAKNMDQIFGILYIIIFPLLGLALLHNRRMVTRYNWEAKWSCVAFGVALILALVK